MAPGFGTLVLTDAQETEMLSMLRALKQVVAEAGDEWTYVRRPNKTGIGTGCFYVFNGEPDCIAGRVLHKLGVSVEDLSLWEGKVCGQMAHYFAEQLDIPVIPFSDPTLSILNTAQDTSDSGHTWGYALQSALDHARTVYGVTVA